jgi:hypothetical protein
MVVELVAVVSTAIGNCRARLLAPIHDFDRNCTEPFVGRSDRLVDLLRGCVGGFPADDLDSGNHASQIHLSPAMALATAPSSGGALGS